MAKKTENIDTAVDDRDVDVEKIFDELDGIVARLELSETSLKDAIDLYGRGVSLVNQVKNTLDQVEKDIIILEDTGAMTDD